MNTEVIAIADEILKGIVINSNSTFISAALGKIGVKVHRHTVFPDQPQVLKQGFADALTRADLVICTGGLGPTLDDLTRSVAADLFSSGFVFKQDIAEDLVRRYGPSLVSLQDQATVPEKAFVLRNTVGTAPGFIFQEKEKMLVLLPGVPLEMEAMLENEVLPFLRQHLPDQARYVSENIFFCHLTEMMLDPILRTIQEQFPSMDIGVYPGYGTLSVTFRSLDSCALSLAKQQIVDAFPTYVFSSKQGKIEDALIDLLRSKKKTVCFAESCTGGLLSHKLVALPGASDVFIGSLVTYSNALKEKVLNVSASSLQQHGSVSAEVVREMLTGAFAVSGADYVIAVSGIAGPSGASEDNPIGTVWAAIGEKNHPPEVFNLQFQGTRQVIMLSTTHRLLGSLYRKIRYGIAASNPEPNTA